VENFAKVIADQILVSGGEEYTGSFIKHHVVKEVVWKWVSSSNIPLQPCNVGEWYGNRGNKCFYVGV
jgi:hypothetical protein